jgi:hypothetical protein
MRSFLRRAIEALRFFPPTRILTPMDNFKILHEGMHFPPGSVVPAEAFPLGTSGHLHIGSIVKTRDPVNVEIPDSLKFASDPSRAKFGASEPGREAESMIGQLQSDLLASSGRIAELELERDKLADENTALKAEVQRLGAEVESALELAGTQESHRADLTTPVKR